MAVLKSPKNQSSKRTWIRFFHNKTRFLRFISKKAYFNKNFSTIPLNWNSTFYEYPAQSFDTKLENTYFMFYLYHYFLRLKRLPLRNSQFLIRAARNFLWRKSFRERRGITLYDDLKFSSKRINWLMVPKIN